MATAKAADKFADALTTTGAAATPVPPPVHPTCGGCPMYEHRAVTQQELDRGAPAGGICHFLPETARKLPNDYCAQHPDFRDYALWKRDTAALLDAQSKGN